MAEPTGLRIVTDDGGVYLPLELVHTGIDADGLDSWVAIFEPWLLEAVGAGLAKVRLDRLPGETTLSVGAYTDEEDEEEDGT